MSLNYVAIGKRIKLLRKKQKLSQDMLSFKIDKTVGYMSYIECGERHLSLDTFVDIANALGVTADYLLAENLHFNAQTDTLELSELLHDCNTYERRVIIDCLKEMKRILRENRTLPRQH